MRIWSLPQRALITAVVWLQMIYSRTLSPLFGPTCRFHPSCSEYAVQALKAHGIMYGSYLAAKRLLRCNGLFEGGIDPVPPAKK